MKNIKTTTQEIRKSMQCKRSTFASSPDFLPDSNLCQKFVLQSPIWKNSQDIALYHAFRGEVETNILIDEAYAQGKNLYFPRCDKEISGKMDFIHIPKKLYNSSFCTGAYGIKEPMHEIKSSPLPEQSLILLPCLAYQENGYRIGYGGGYYDRILAINAHKKNYYTTLLLAFSFQKNNAIIPQTWDIPVQYIANEKELLCCNT